MRRQSRQPTAYKVPLFLGSRSPHPDQAERASACPRCPRVLNSRLYLSMSYKRVNYIQHSDNINVQQTQPKDLILSYCHIKSIPTFKMPIAGPGRDVTIRIARKVSKMTLFVPMPLEIK
jgi:hypothetical protein